MLLDGEKLLHGAGIGGAVVSPSGPFSIFRPFFGYTFWWSVTFICRARREYWSCQKSCSSNFGRYMIGTRENWIEKHTELESSFYFSAIFRWTWFFDKIIVLAEPYKTNGADHQSVSEKWLENWQRIGGGHQPPTPRVSYKSFSLDGLFNILTGETYGRLLVGHIARPCFRKNWIIFFSLF